MNPGKSIRCSLETCPSGCTILTVGTAKLHLAPHDYLALVKAMLHHAWTQGLDVPTEATERPLLVLH